MKFPVLQGDRKCIRPDRSIAAGCEMVGTGPKVSVGLGLQRGGLPRLVPEGELIIKCNLPALRVKEQGWTPSPSSSVQGAARVASG